MPEHGGPSSPSSSKYSEALCPMPYRHERTDPPYIPGLLTTVNFNAQKKRIKSLPSPQTMAGPYAQR